MNIYYRKSAVFVFILCQEASKQPLSSQGMTAFPVCATKTLAVDRERGYNNFVHMVSNTIDNELNQKPSKRRRSIPEDDTRRAQYGVLTWEKNTYVRTWGLKRGEGVRSKGAYFWEVKVHVIMSLHLFLSLLLPSAPHSPLLPCSTTHPLFLQNSRYPMRISW